MPRSPISLNVVPDADLEATNTAHVVLNAYTTAKTFSRNEKKAFDAGIRAWRERNPNAPTEEGAAAVANIICHKL
jgi:hypothetical protein